MLSGGFTASIDEMMGAVKKSVCLFFSDIYRCRVALVAAAAYLLAAQMMFGWVCPVKILTGWDCPGCGLTRGCLCVLTFHWKQACEYNITSFGWVVVILWLGIQRYVLDRKKLRWEFPVISIGVITILYFFLHKIFAVF